MTPNDIMLRLALTLAVHRRSKDVIQVVKGLIKIAPEGSKPGLKMIRYSQRPRELIRLALGEYEVEDGNW